MVPLPPCYLPQIGGCPPLHPSLAFPHLSSRPLNFEFMSTWDVASNMTWWQGFKTPLEDHFPLLLSPLTLRLTSSGALLINQSIAIRIKYINYNTVSYIWTLLICRGDRSGCREAKGSSLKNSKKNPGCALTKNTKVSHCLFHSRQA